MSEFFTSTLGFKFSLSPALMASYTVADLVIRLNELITTSRGLRVRDKCSILVKRGEITDGLYY